MFMRAVRHQQELRRQQALEEARRLEQEAKALKQRNKRTRKSETEAQRHRAWVQRVSTDFGLDPERPITEVPPTPKDHQEISIQSLRQGRAYIRTLYNTKTNSTLYEVIEPRLSKTEQDIFKFLRETLVRTMDGRQGRTEEMWEQVLEDAVRQAIIDYSVIVDEVSTQRLLYHLNRELLGYGPVDALMIDVMLEDISCDGPGIPVYVFHRQLGSIRSNVVFEDEQSLDAFVIRLAQRSGKHISIADPLLDATLPDGSRLQATLSREVTTRGSSFTIRKFREKPLTPPELIKFGTMDSRLVAYYWLLVEHGASMIMAGGTASGKTTTLNAVCQFLPVERKVVSIEDTREINLDHENWIAATTRSGFGGQEASGKPAGSIDMYELLEAALRQRPEYLLVGEVRGPEALTLFQAMATGHAVYSTMHADSVESAVYRLENPPINVPRLMLQTLDTMTIQGQVRVEGKLVRRVLEVTELVGIDPATGELLTNKVFRWDPATGRHEYMGSSHHLEGVRKRENMTQQQMEDEWNIRVEFLEWLYRHGVDDFRRFSQVVAEYYQRPEQVIDRMRRDQPPVENGPEPQDEQEA